MMPSVDLVSSIYVYKTNQKKWKNTGKHDMYCLAYQVSGCYDHKFKSQNLVAESDSLLFFPKRTPYSVSCTDKGEALCVTFSGEVGLSQNFISCKAHPEIKLLFQKLMNYKNLLSVSNMCEAKAIIYKLLAFLYAQASPDYVDPDNRNKMCLAYEYMAENYTDISLKTGEIAKDYGISAKYFRTLFKKIYNATPTQCLISMRLQHAVKLITETNLSITDIAQMSGFSDVYYFSKLFKDRFDCSPKEYRKRCSDFIVLT